MWGREIVHFNLQTTGGPSWKPLPVIFTTLFAPFGKAAPDLWLVVARAGAVMAAVMVFKLCVRLTLWLGERAAPRAPPGASAAASCPRCSPGRSRSSAWCSRPAFISDNALGYSEGLMTALVLIAVERHLDGHRRQAFAVGFFAALDRPEIWLFWGPYGLWLCWKDPGARKLVIGLFVLIPVLWFLPEYWGSGHFLRGVNRAQHPALQQPCVRAAARSARSSTTTPGRRSCCGSRSAAALGGGRRRRSLLLRALTRARSALGGRRQPRAGAARRSSAPACSGCAGGS